MTRDTLARWRHPLTVGAVWTAYALALAASFQHVRRAFGALEPSPGSLTGYAAAAAVEVGTAALALALVARRRSGARDGRLWVGLAAMAAVSALANADAALTALGGGQRPLWAAGLAVDPLDVARAMIGAASLPALVLYLAAAAETLTAAAAAPLEAAAMTSAIATAPRSPGRRRGPHAPLAASGSSAADRRPAPLTARSAATLNRLLDAVTIDPTATRDDLAARLDVSTDTIRRAAERGQSLGLLERRGGRWQASGERVAAAVGRPPYRAAATVAPTDGAAP